jgi:hypothetical protein
VWSKFILVMGHIIGNPYICAGFIHIGVFAW